MFRSKPLRRAPRGPFEPGQGPRKMLRLAHRLMESGQYPQAYPLLKRLADGAERRAMPVRAAHLYLQASRARLEMGNAKDAAALARHAMHLLANSGQSERVGTLLPRVITALESKGHREEAVALRAEVATLAGSSALSAGTMAEQVGNLPTRCPSCNGPVRVDEVTWVDSQSAECVYCGSVIRAD